MNLKTEEFLIIALAIIIFVGISVVITPSYTGYTFYTSSIEILEYNNTPQTLSCKKDGESIECDSLLTISSLQNSDCIPGDNCGFIDVGTSEKSFLKIKFGDLGIPNLTILSANVTFEYADEKDTFDTQKLKCYDGDSWVKVIEPEISTNEITRIYNINDDCIKPYTKANDIKLKFGQFNPNSDSGKIFFDYVFLRVFVQNITICEENWDCINWTECINNTQTRICTDQNNCETEENKPIETQDCTTEEPCIENWTCTDWSDCINNTQLRTCTDENNCNTTENIPTELQNCTIEETNSTEPEEPVPSPPSSSGKPSVTRFKSTAPTTKTSAPVMETHKVTQQVELPKETSTETIIPTGESVKKVLPLKLYANIFLFTLLIILIYAYYHKRIKRN